MSAECATVAGAVPVQLSGLDSRLLRTAFDDAPVGVGVCDEDGRFLEVNDSLCRTLGVGREDVLGRPFLTFVHPSQRAACVSAYFRAVVVAACRPTGSEHGEVRCLTRGGDSIWLAVTWTVTAPDESGNQYGIVHLRDITARKRVERELAVVQRRLELAFRCSPIGVAVVGTDGQLLQTNPALQAMMGYSSSQLSRLGLRELSHPEDREELDETLRALLDGAFESHDTVRRYLRNDGSVLFARRVLAVGDGVGTEGAAGKYLLLQLEDVTGERMARDELRAQQLRDPLTRLVTRESLVYELEVSSLPRSLVVLELRDMSRLNGVLGSDAGDQVLIQAAQRLQLCCRDGDLAARIGGAEFAILLDDSDGTSAAAVAQRVVASIAAPMLIGGKSVTVGASIGFTTDPAGARTLTELLQRAELALHINKSGHDLSTRDRCTGFQQDMLDASARQLSLETDLRAALADDAVDRSDSSVTVVYQPIFDVATGNLRGAETLSRWVHPTLGPVEPYEFVALAERTGLIDQLVERSLRRSCADLARWRADNLGGAVGFAVSVNVSPSALAAPDFPELVAQCLAEYELPPESLIVEITETALAESDPIGLANAAKLRDLGVGLALDDFGVGHSSLSRLAQLPVTSIKLDRSFISDVQHAEAEAPIIRAVLAMATELGINVVVEGIETLRQLELVRGYHCPQAQGFLLGRPQPADAMAALLGTGDAAVA